MPSPGENGDVHLTGTVKNRDDKRRAEQLAEQVSGVDNVLNHLRLEKPQDWRTDTSRGATTMPAGAGATSNLGDLGTPNTAGSTPAADGNMRTGKTQ